MESKTVFNTIDQYGNNIGQGQSEETSMGPHYGKGPRGWKKSDEKITEEASEALYRNSQIDASEISLTVREACIYLDGTVDSRETKNAVELSVENIIGVKKVINDLNIFTSV